MEIVVKQRVRPFASGWCGCHGSCLVGASSVLGAAAPEPRKPKTGKKECLQSRTTPTEMDRSRSNQNKLPCAPFACLGSDSHGILCLAGGGLLGPAGTEPGQVCCICTYIYICTCIHTLDIKIKILIGRAIYVAKTFGQRPFACPGSDSHGILCLVGGALLGPAGTEPGQVGCTCMYIYIYAHVYIL